MADQVTLALIGTGGAGLVLWYASRALERRREINRLVRGEPIMAQSRDSSLERLGERGVAIMNDLPARLDPGWMEHQVDHGIDARECIAERRCLQRGWYDLCPRRSGVRRLGSDDGANMDAACDEVCRHMPADEPCCARDGHRQTHVSAF